MTKVIVYGIAAAGKTTFILALLSAYGKPWVSKKDPSNKSGNPLIICGDLEISTWYSTVPPLSPPGSIIIHVWREFPWSGPYKCDDNHICVINAGTIGDLQSRAKQIASEL